MNILSLYPLPGISYTHDANAALVSDAGILFAAEEERFLRAQHSIGHTPDRASLLALKHAGVTPADIDHLVFTSMERCWERPDYGTRVQFVREQLQIPDSVRVSCVTHHLAHSALAVLSSPFDDCLFLTLDGGGDGHMGHWGTFVNGRFRLRERVALSPAQLYQSLTSIGGFLPFEEGKLMGLAAYGDIHDRLLSWLRRHFRVKPDSASLQTDLTFRWRGTLEPQRVDIDRFARHKYLRWHLDCREPEDERWIDDIAPPDFARTAQTFFQDLLTEIVSNITRQTRISKVACAGGAFSNVAASGHVLQSLPGIDLYVPLAPHDAGLSLGAALWTQRRLRRPRPERPFSPLLGPQFALDEVETVLRDYDLAFERPADFEDTVARLIAGGRIVGWFDGRAEYGARALGARSILADPRSRGAKARLNQLIKRRDWFMPFAPSVLEEHAAALLEDVRPNPYMTLVFRATSTAAQLMPDAVHADGSCRAHIVVKSLSPRYHALISRFHEITGVPAVLNTSFNRHGLPMVATPRDAVRHLLEGCVDVLAIEGHLVHFRRSSYGQAVEDERELLQRMRFRRRTAQS